MRLQTLRVNLGFEEKEKDKKNFKKLLSSYTDISIKQLCEKSFKGK